ncbi:MAG: hypothetical protein ACPGXL_07290 [Chitinophagales bacterium]
MENLFGFYQVQAEDKKIINLLATAFQNNERMSVLLGKSRDDFFKKVTHVISYSYFMVKKIGGIFISKDRNTYLLYYRKSQFYFSLKDCFNYLYLAFGTIGIKRLKKVYLREKNVKNTRQKEIQKRGDKDYLYVWFLAQRKEHQGLKGLVEAKRFIIQRAKTLDLPIYMETTEKRLVRLYERMGFKFYETQIEEESGLCVWFGRYH